MKNLLSHRVFEGLKGELVRASAWVFFARVAGMGLNFAVAIIVARWYGKEATGLVALINSSALVFGTVAASGQGTYLIREFASLSVADDFSSKQQLYRRSLGLVLVLSLLIAIPMIFFLRQNFSDLAWKNSQVAVGIVVVALIAHTFVHLTVNASRALVPTRVYAFFLLLPPTVNLSIVTIWGYLANTSVLVPSAALAIGTAIAAGTAACYNLLCLRRISEVDAEISLVTGVADTLRTYLNLIRRGLPFLIAAGSTVLLTEGNIVIASFALPVSEIGVYAVAQRIANLSAFALTTINLVAQPNFARLRANNPSEIGRYGRQVSNLIFLTTLPLAVFLLCTRHWLIDTAFGSEFEDAATLLVILICGHVVAALTGATNPYLTMTGGHTQLAWITAVSASLSIVVTITLTSTLGVYGPAIGVSFGLIVLHISTLVTIRLRDGFWICWFGRFGRQLSVFPEDFR